MAASLTAQRDLLHLRGHLTADHIRIKSFAVAGQKQTLLSIDDDETRA
jgi:hypothetical protein